MVFLKILQTYTQNVLSTGDQDDDALEDPARLPYFPACSFATILEDIVTQLHILDECNSETRISKVKSDMTALLTRKYGVAEKAVKDELDDINLNNLHCVEYKLDKLQWDRKLVHQVLTETYLNLSKERKFQTLVEYVDNIETKLRRELNRQLRQQRIHVKSVTYDTNTEIERLKSNLEDSELNSQTRGRYVGGWQRARTEQHLQTIYDKEIVPIHNIEHLKTKIDQEQRVHTEIEVLINIKINEVLEKVEEWMSKYDKDMENMDLKIQLKRNEYEHTYDRRLELEQTLEKHAELIKNWVAFKEEREAIRQYREKMTTAAVAVQAWWRGLLVRLQLGPYKVVKRKGAANKADEKAGKKKK
ncbi:unnamed protein product, partial [Brenthis ino]